MASGESTSRAAASPTGSVLRPGGRYLCTGALSTALCRLLADRWRRMRKADPERGGPCEALCTQVLVPLLAVPYLVSLAGFPTPAPRPQLHVRALARPQMSLCHLAWPPNSSGACQTAGNHILGHHLCPVLGSELSA